MEQRNFVVWYFGPNAAIERHIFGDWASASRFVDDKNSNSAIIAGLNSPYDRRNQIEQPYYTERVA